MPSWNTLDPSGSEEWNAMAPRKTKPEAAVPRSAIHQLIMPDGAVLGMECALPPFDAGILKVCFPLPPYQDISCDDSPSFPFFFSPYLR